MAENHTNLVPARDLSVKERLEILSRAYETIFKAATNRGISVLQFLEQLFPIPESEVPDAIPESLQSVWVYTLDRSWGRAYRGVFLLLIYDGRVDQVTFDDIMAGEGFFGGDSLHEWRVSHGFFEK